MARLKGQIVLTALSLIVLLVYGVFAQTSITINGTQGGKVFDGMGACSGGGGNSRLLIDYPSQQQSDILDYLFKPGCGACIQLMKIEIGGGANSTAGAEPTIEPTKGNINCNCGYEFWLMKQAKERNPNIKLIGLCWTLPGWISWYSTDQINYIIAWLNCCKADSLTIDYIGGCNESQGPGNLSWWQQFRTALNTAGYNSIKLVGGDGVGMEYTICGDLSSNSTWAALMDVVSIHYPCGNDGGDASTCPSQANCVALNKPLWDGEGGSQQYNTGAPVVLRSVIRGYIDGKFTAFMNWPLVGTMYTSIPYNDMGLIIGSQPWTGNYSIGLTTWTTAHVTQFTQVGWTFITSACGYLGGNEQNGTYMTLKSPNGNDYSLILETSTGSSAQTVNVTVSGGLSTGPLHVWSTNLGSTNSVNWFVHQADITPSNGTFSLTMQPNYAYSLSTISGQGKGTATSPGTAALAIPYVDNFAGYPTGSEAKYLSSLQGDFQSQPKATGTGNCIMQMLNQTPLFFFNPGPGLPWAVLGDVNWTNYTVNIDVLMEQASTVYLAGRVNNTGGSNSNNRGDDFDGYALQISSTGAWTVYDYSGSNATSKASGTITAPGLNTWITLSMTFNGSAISAKINGTQVASFTSTTHTSGQVGIGILGFQTDQFANLSITAPGVPVSGPVMSRAMSSPNMAVIKTPEGFSISIDPQSDHANPYSLGIYDLAGRPLARLTGITGNRVVWDVSRRNFAEGLYIVKAELPGRGVIDRTLMFSR
jgi:hypothetical protein